MVKLTILFREFTDVEKIRTDLKNHTTGLGKINKKGNSLYIEALSMQEASWSRDRILDHFQEYVKEINFD